MSIYHVLASLLLFSMASLAMGDNCSSLSDCYGTVAAAAAAAAAIAAAAAAAALSGLGLGSSRDPNPDSDPFISPEDGAKIAATAKEWADANVPYKTGGKTKKGADCSGSTTGIFEEAGLKYPHQGTATFAKLEKMGYFRRSPGNQPQAGDVGLYHGHVLIFDPRAGSPDSGNNVWTASHGKDDKHEKAGPSYGPAKSTYFGDKPTWYRRTNKI